MHSTIQPSPNPLMRILIPVMVLVYGALFLTLVGACSASSKSTDASHSETLPELTAIDLAGGQLQIVATTSIVADVVARVGGEQIALTQLFPIGADAHSFEATPQDLVALSDAHVVFINGLDLEESLTDFLDGLDNVPVISVNSGVETIELQVGEEHADEAHDDHDGTDPHTWFSVHAVEQWVHTIESGLSTLDPTNAQIYADNASAYLVDLTALETELAEIVAPLPLDKRKLVTDHEALGYLAAAYNFEIIGSVIPSLSSAAAPSAQNLAALQDQIESEGVSAIFVSVSTNPTMAQQLAQDIGVKVVPIYVESLSDAGGPAETYIDLMRYTVTTIVDALQEK